MNIVEKVTRVLKNKFNPIKIDIVDLSSQHLGHAGSGGLAHLKIDIQSEVFRDKSTIQMHRLIYDELGSLINKEIHALSINAQAPNK